MTEMPHHNPLDQPGRVRTPGHQRAPSPANDDEPDGPLPAHQQTEDEKAAAEADAEEGKAEFRPRGWLSDDTRDTFELTKGGREKQPREQESGSDS